MPAWARTAPAEPLDPGDLVDGWEVLLLPGHADGHIGLLRDGVLVGGDVLLPDISPTIGVWPGCEPDPLGRYLETLARIVEISPRVVLPGHGEPVADPPARARATAAHHRDRLDAAAAALGPEPRAAYEVSLDLWPAELDPGQRSFAIAESLAHLVRLVGDGRAYPLPGPDGRMRFTPPPARALPEEGAACAVLARGAVSGGDTPAGGSLDGGRWTQDAASRSKRARRLGMGERVRAGDVELWVDRHGQGPDVLLIAGLGDPAEAWQSQLDGLADRDRLIAFDNRGAGRTPLAERPLMATMADDAAALLRALEISSAHVAGFSMGSAIAQESALGTASSSAAWCS
ncbi:MAG TPA: alpha/beta fold hydrolase [Miltoncostaeaceae bacterium]|nr:alpha/beta fold hydrolase [Miltoncostaeaceae bacterium]